VIFTNLNCTNDQINENHAKYKSSMLMGLGELEAVVSAASAAATFAATIPLTASLHIVAYAALT
jgi:hypothetical protein